MSDGHSFNSISLHGRGGSTPGILRVHSGGISWRKQDGSKSAEVDKSELLGLSWMKVPRSHELGVSSREGLNYKFIGFRDADVPTLNAFFQSTFGITPEEKQLSVSGKNHGDVDLNGNMLTFVVGNKQAFEISLADVSHTQVQGKNDEVMLEFHVDDTTGANEKDSLMEISFHVPSTNTKYVGDENRTPAQVLREMINDRTDAVPGGERPVVTFDGIAILTPRGRYNIELHLSFLRLQGQANDFKMQYSSVVRVFWLPKSNQPHTFVVVTLDPPIRKGQTLYPHIVMQFETDAVIDTTLSMSEELLNSKYGGKLKQENKGLVHEIFVAILRGLSGAKVTRPGSFRSHLKGFAVKSSLKAEDGILYPLDKSFFFLPKPPTLILHEEIDYVEFERHTAGGSNMHYFDFLVRLKSEQEHLFRNIQRNEYHNLFKFVNEKGLKIMNLGTHDLKPDSAVAAVLEGDLDDAVDPHLERIKNAVDESDEEDEDFVAEKDDDGSPSDDSGEEESDASDSGGEKEESVRKKPRKEPPPAKASSSKKQTKDGDGEGSKKKKKPKEKKDPNAPKKNQSAYLIFCNSERENYRKNNPEKSPPEVMAALAEHWKKLTAEEKAPYEAKARVDKIRYNEEMSDYKNPQTASRGSPGESGSS